MALLDIHSHRAAQHDDLLIRIQSIRVDEVRPLGGPFTVGVHPWYLAELDEQLQKLESYLNDENLVAIGEAGLDRLSEWPEELQLRALRQQIEWSEEKKLPLILHVVKSWDPILALMKEYKPQQPWIVHGFRSGVEHANQLMDAGLFLSFGLRHNKDSLRAAFDRSMGLLESDEESFSMLDLYYEVANDVGRGIQDLQRQLTAISMALFPKLALDSKHMFLRSQG